MRLRFCAYGWSDLGKQRLVISLDRFSGENAPETPFVSPFGSLADVAQQFASLRAP